MKDAWIPYRRARSKKQITAVPGAKSIHAEARTECERLMKIFHDYLAYGGGFSKTQASDFRHAMLTFQARAYSTSLCYLKNLMKQIMPEEET